MSCADAWRAFSELVCETRCSSESPSIAVSVGYLVPSWGPRSEQTPTRGNMQGQRQPSTELRRSVSLRHRNPWAAGQEELLRFFVRERTQIKELRAVGAGPIKSASYREKQRTADGRKQSLSDIRSVVSNQLHSV